MKTVNKQTKKSWGSVLGSDIMDFKFKTSLRETKTHYILVSVSKQQEDTVYFYIPNNRPPNEAKTELRGEIIHNDS